MEPTVNPDIQDTTEKKVIRKKIKKQNKTIFSDFQELINQKKQLIIKKTKIDEELCLIDDKIKNIKEKILNFIESEA